jgi:hypothetical protein
MALHRAGQAHAERLHRELQRSPAGRIVERDGPSLAQARIALKCWLTDYNDARPRSQL